ncbi:MAG: hypothetical protein WD877_00655 [Candidatus Saccharimonadales bacterium]
MQPKIQTIFNRITLSFAAFAANLFLLLPAVALAAPAPNTDATTNPEAPNQPKTNTSQSQQSDPDICNKDNPTNASLSKCLENNPIVKRINQVVAFLSAGVGIIVIGVIILGGIQYAIAGDNPTAVAAARQRILNGLIALLIFILTFSFLQWLIPGGIFDV